VVKLAAQELQATREKSGKPDPGRAAAAVCKKALEMNSKDNLSCMLVLFGGGEAAGAELELLPGPFSRPTESSFRKAYEAMAAHAGFTLAQAVEDRYDHVRQARAEAVAARGNDALEIGTYREEIASFGEGPPQDLKKGAERTKWFQNWLDGHEVEEEVNIADLQGKTREELVTLVQTDPKIRALAEIHGAIPMEAEEDGPPKRQVRVPGETVLRRAVEANPGLKWNDDYLPVCGEKGMVLVDDESDGTSKVRIFSDRVKMTAWFPTDILEDLSRKVEIASLPVVQRAVEAHPQLKWDPKYEKCCGRRGTVIRDDADGTSQVVIENLLTGWFPTSVLVDVVELQSEANGADSGMATAGSEAVQDSSAAKRARTDTTSP
jgi:hypothetical protein